MVKSKLDDLVVYKEIKDIEQIDKNTDVSMFQIELYNIKVVIALGKIKNDFIESGILFSPVYLILKDSDKIEKIGVYEINANDYINVIDDEGDLDITILDGPLLFSYVDEQFVKEFMVDQELIVDTDESDSEILDDEGDISPEKKTVLEDLEIEDDDDDEHKSESKKDDAKIVKNYVKKDKEPWIQTWLKNNYYKIFDKGSDGDCFFLSTEAAFKDINVNMSVEKQRKLLSENMKVDQFNLYKELYKGTANELVENNNKIKVLQEKNGILSKQHKELVGKAKKEKDKPKQKTMLKKIMEIKKEHGKNKETIKRLLVDNQYAKSNLVEFNFMKGVNNLNKLKEIVKTSEYWADSYAIKELEMLLNVKFIILSKQNYDKGDYEKVLLCPDMVPKEVEKKGSFKPKYYIILEYVGNIHYRIVEYKEKKILRFHEIPYKIKDLIVNRCMNNKGKSIYEYIPKFKALIETEKKEPEETEKKEPEETEKKEPEETEKKELEETEKKESDDEVESEIDEIESNPTPENNDDKLYDDNIQFVFHSKSKDAKPGKGVHEKITLQAKDDFKELSNIKNWRKMLSNFYIAPFKLDDQMWNSVEHYYHSKKFSDNPEFAKLFSLDSKSEISKDPQLAKGAGGKTGKIVISKNPTKYKQFRPKNVKMIDNFYIENGVGEKSMERAQFEKYSQNKELREMLLLTKNAKLVHAEKKRGKKTNLIPFYDTMRIRDKLK